ncbi:MAG: hypothetical protein Q9195_005636 [Heterodermia aff. obscurata]
MLKNSHLLIWLCGAGIFGLAHSQSGSGGISVIASSTAGADFSQSDFGGISAIPTDTAGTGFSNSDLSGTSAKATSTAGAGSSSIEYAETLTRTITVGERPTWNLTINDTEPIFYYCSAPGSCMDQGMVGVINSNSSTSFETQYQYAKNGSYDKAPGKSGPTGGTLPSQTATSSPSASPSASHNKLSPGAIAGMAICGLAFVTAIGFLLFLLGRRLGGDRTELKFLRRNNNNQTAPPAPTTTQSYHLPQLTYPYDSADPRFGKQEAYDVPAPAYPKAEESRFVAELASPPLGMEVSRAGSPCSELETRRQTVSPLPRGFIEGVEPGKMSRELGRGRGGRGLSLGWVGVGMKGNRGMERKVFLKKGMFQYWTFRFLNSGICTKGKEIGF